MTLGRTRGSSRRNTSIASRSPAQRLANAARASCRLRERQERCLRLEAAVPADAGPFELLRSLLGEEVEVVERVLSDGWPSSRSDISVPQRLCCWIARVNLPCAVPWLVIAGSGAGVVTVPASPSGGGRPTQAAAAAYDPEQGIG